MGKVNFINQDGAGFSQPVEFEEGTTVEQFLRNRGISNPNDYYIRLRLSPTSPPLEVTADQMLSDGNVVSAVAKEGTVSASTVVPDGGRIVVTPKNVTGAYSW